MKQYVTFYSNPATQKRKITNPKKFLITKGKEGTRDHRLLKYKNSQTVFHEYATPSRIRNSKKFQDFNRRNIHLYIIQKVQDIYDRYLRLLNENDNIKEHLYYKFKIPKRSGGMRDITAPHGPLKILQDELVIVLRDNLKLLPHHNAHAYTKNRSIKTNAETHRYSNHFGNIDLENFFPSITTNKIIKIMSEIDMLGLELYFTPLCQIAEMATLDDKLPQGTPLSPLISNLIMIPFDYHLTKLLQENEQSIVATRYADDITFSSFYPFAQTKQESKSILHNYVREAMFRAYDNKHYFTIKEKKSRISTKNGKNRITGIKVNKDHDVSIGYKEKRQIKQDLASLIIAKLNNQPEPKPSNQVVGMYNFLHSIEPEYGEYLLRTLERKFKLPRPTIKYITG